MLELGAGFNPDFTGRENVYLNGAVLGLTRQQVDERFDRITEFADIGDFIEQPVKTYSSGMYIRLAFAVAINTDPRILIVDEALSVGDEAFQRKCFARIEELKRGGCTILFVSHSPGSVVQLCDRAILLDGGELLYSGTPKLTVALYQRLLYAGPERLDGIRRDILNTGADADADADTEDLQIQLPAPVADSSGQVRVTPTGFDGAERYDAGLRPESTVEYESRGARIVDPHLVTESGARVNVLVPGQPYRYRYRVDFDQDAQHVHFGMMIKSVTGVELFGMASHATGDAIEHVQAGASYEVEFRFHSHLLPGTFFMNAGVIGCTQGVEGTFMHRVLDALMFKVELGTSDRRKAGFYDLAIEPAAQVQLVLAHATAQG